VCTPGVLIEVMATSMSASSRNDSALARDQRRDAAHRVVALGGFREEAGEHVVVGVQGEGPR
jgi:hypothetical protein